MAVLRDPEMFPIIVDEGPTELARADKANLYGEHDIDDTQVSKPM
jgi:hypothetical protein